MGLFARDIELQHKGHRIALAVALHMNSGNFKLYIDGEQVDQETVPLWRSFVGGKVVLRGKLRLNGRDGNALVVKAVANLRVLRHNDYEFYVNDQLIHRERATPGGV